jgi:hypothetical protein
VVEAVEAVAEELVEFLTKAVAPKAVQQVEQELWVVAQVPMAKQVVTEIATV